MLKLKLAFFSVPSVNFNFRILNTKIRMIRKVLDTSDDSITDLLFLLLILLYNNTMTNRYTHLIFIELNFGHYFTLFGIIKGKLTSPLFLAFFENNIITLVYSYEVLEQH